MLLGCKAGLMTEISAAAKKKLQPKKKNSSEKRRRGKLHSCNHWIVSSTEIKTSWNRCMWKTYLGGVHFSSSTKYIKLKTLPIANEVRAHLASTHQFLGSVADKEILQEPAPSPCHDSSAVQSAIPSKCIGGEPAPRFEK